MRYSTASFNLQLPLSSLRSSSIILRFFLVFPSLLSFLQRVLAARERFDQSSSVSPCLTVCWIFLYSLTLCKTRSFFTLSVKLMYSILLQHHISKHSRYLYFPKGPIFFNTIQSSAADNSLGFVTVTQSIS